VGFSLLDPHVRRFLREHPEVQLHVEYTHWDRIYNEVGNGDMDLGVVACPQKHRAVEALPLTSEQLSLVVPPGHPLAGQEKVHPRQIANEPFVAFTAGIPTRRTIDRLLRSYRVKPNVVMQFDNIQLLKRALRSNKGISILPAGNVQREVRKGQLVSIPLEEEGKWVRPVAIVRRRGRPPGPAERMFLGILREARD
jgi:DNA-binding transcriptional LysR family regulator